MAGVYSGGLVYEYSEEESNYGLVTINGGTVKENQDFTNLESALKKNASPKSAKPNNPNGGASTCPPQGTHWNPGMPDSIIPAIPSQAQKYIKSGAGNALGLTSAGTQLSGDSGKSTGTSPVGQSGTTSGSGSSGSKSPAVALSVPALALGPIVSGLAVIVASVAGAFLL